MPAGREGFERTIGKSYNARNFCERTMILSVLLLAAHLLAILLAVGLPLVWGVVEFRGGGVDPAVQAAWRRAAAAESCCWLLVGGAVGLLLGVWIWSPALAAALRQVGSRLHFAAVEYLFSLIVVALVGWPPWRTGSAASAGSRFGRWLRGLALLVAVTNLAYHFPVLFALVKELRLAAAPASPPDVLPLSSGALRGMIFRGRIAGVLVHFVLAAWLAAAVYLLARRSRFPLSFPAQQSLAWSSLAAIVGQVASGFFLWAQLPRTVRWSLLGVAQGGAALGTAAAVAALAAAHVALAVDPQSSRARRAAFLSLAAVAVGMAWLSIDR